MMKSKVLCVVLTLCLLLTSFGILPTVSFAEFQAGEKPEGLEMSDLTTYSANATLTWSSVSDATGYIVYVNDCKKAETVAALYGFTDLAPGTTYTIYVKAVDAEGNISEASEPLTVTTNYTRMITGPNETYATLQDLEKAARPGDLVLIKDGSYNYTSRLFMQRSGTEDKWITFKPENPGQVLIYGTAVLGASYVRLDGIKMDAYVNGAYLGANSKAVDVTKPFTQIANMDIRNFDYGLYYDSLAGNTYVTHNYFYKCARIIRVAGDNSVFELNEIDTMDNNGRVAIHCKGFMWSGSNIIIRNNYIHGTISGPQAGTSVNIIQGYDNGVEAGKKASNVLIENNRFLGFSAQAIALANNQGGPNGIYYLSDWVIRNNIIGGFTGIGISTTHIPNMIVENNAFIGEPTANGGAGAYYGIEFAGTGSSGGIRNNIFMNNSSACYLTNTAGEVTAGNNLFYNAPAANPVNSADITGNPLFEDPDNNDFRLTTGSPAIDAGVPTIFKYDILGNIRPMGYGFDIGPYEFPGPFEAPIEPVSVTLSAENITIVGINNADELTATVMPSNAHNKELEWESDDPSVATVEAGIVTAKSVGTATITVKVKNTELYDTCEVDVVEEPPVFGIATPAAYRIYAVGSDISITVAMGEEELEKVEYYINGQKVGESDQSTSAFDFEISNAEEGIYRLYAVPYDVSGPLSQSEEVVFFVHGATAKDAIIADNEWVNIPFGKDSLGNDYPTQGLLTVNVDVVPLKGILIEGYGYVGVSFINPADGFSKVPVMMSFDITGIVNALNGPVGYSSDNEIQYQPFKKYTLTYKINIPKRSFNLYITDDEGNTRTIGINYGFRVDSKLTQPMGDTLDRIVLRGDTGTMAILGHSVETFVQEECVIIPQDGISLLVDETRKLGAVILPEESTGQQLEWSSSDPSVATVDQGGNVTAKSSGTTTITVKISGKELTDTCIVKVTGEFELSPADIEQIVQEVTAYRTGRMNSPSLQYPAGQLPGDTCWQAKYGSEVFPRAYYSTYDTRVLDEWKIYLDFLMTKLSTRPGGQKAWIVENVWYPAYQGEYVVDEAIMLQMYLQFCEIVMKDPELMAVYGQSAQEYLDLAEHIVDKTEENGQWIEYGTYGVYADNTKWKNVATGEWEDRRGMALLDGNGASNPHNMNLHMGVVHLQLYRITGDEFYLDRAVKTFARIKQTFSYDEDLDRYVWNYRETFVEMDFNPQTLKPGRWVDVHPTSPSYQSGEVTAMVEAYHTGVVFTEADIQRMINTNLWMWNKSFTDPSYVSANNNGSGALWSALAGFNEDLQELYRGQINKTGSKAEHAYANIYTLNDPVSFVRKYVDESEAIIPDIPITHGPKIVMAIVSPCEFNSEEFSRMIVGTRILTAGQLSIDLYSKNGEEHIANLKTETISSSTYEDGFSWDGKHPVTNELMTGEYRVRWTVGDNIREIDLIMTDGQEEDSAIVITGPESVSKDQTFTVDIGFTEADDIYDADITVEYDVSKLEFVEYTDIDGGPGVFKDENSDPGTLRFILAAKGTPIDKDTPMIQLTLKGKDTTSSCDIDVTEALLVRGEDETTPLPIYPTLDGIKVEVTDEAIPGDIHVDGVVDVLDLYPISRNYGATNADANWDSIKIADVNGDKEIGLEDLVFVAQEILK